MLRMELQIDAERLAAWEGLIRTVGDLLKTFDRELEDSEGIPLTWYDVLVHLSESPQESLRHQVLADSLLLSRSGVTRLVDRMAQAGLVCREAAPEDRRVSYVVLTPEGRATLDRAGPGHIQSVVEHFARHLKDSETAALRSFLTSLLEEDPTAQ